MSADNHSVDEATLLTFAVRPGERWPSGGGHLGEVTSTVEAPVARRQHVAGFLVGLARSSGAIVDVTTGRNHNLSSFKPKNATVQAVSAGGALDAVPNVASAEVIYENGQLGLRQWIRNDRLSCIETIPIPPDALPGLLTALKQARRHPPQALDTKALAALIDVVERQLGGATSNLFDRAKFGDISDQPGIARELLGHYGKGVDTVGLIDDVAGILRYSERPLPMPQGPFVPLSGADASSLARSPHGLSRRRRRRRAAAGALGPGAPGRRPSCQRRAAIH